MSGLISDRSCMVMPPYDMRQMLRPLEIDHNILCFSVDNRGGICYAQSICLNHFQEGLT
jgi:hypothetical protein